MGKVDAAVDIDDGDAFAVDGGVFGDELIEVHLLVVSAPGQKPALFQSLDHRIHPGPPGRPDAPIAILRVPHTTASFPPGEDACAVCPCVRNEARWIEENGRWRVMQG